MASGLAIARPKPAALKHFHPQTQVPQAAATLLQPVLSAAQAATAQLPPPPSDPLAAAASGPPNGPSLSSSHPYLAPLVDRIACLFAHVDQREAVASMLGVCVCVCVCVCACVLCTYCPY